MKTLTIFLPRLLFPIAAILMLVISCTKRDTILQREENVIALFEPTDFNKLDIHLQKIIQALQWRPVITSEFSKLAENREIVWSKSLVALRNNTVVALIPLQGTGETSYDAFVAVELDSALRFRAFERDRFSEYVNNDAGYPSLFEINHALNALNHLGLGKTGYSVGGLSTAERKKLEIYRTGCGRVSGKVMLAPAYTFSTCYSWSACAVDGNGNCLEQTYYFTECITETVWFNSNYGGYHSGGGNDYQPGGGGGGSHHNPDIPSSAEEMKDVQVLPPSVPIMDAGKYMSCFDRSLPAKFTIYVDQPVAGTAEPVSIIGGIGHTYLAFEQNLQGKLVRRTVGFYNQMKVDPVFNKSSRSTLGNDSTHEYNIKWETALTATQFDKMIEATINHTDTYNIENYNCANFVLDVASAGGIDLPRSKGWWYTGSGFNPGALGEDLRKQPGAVSGKGYTENNLGECP